MLKIRRSLLMTIIAIMLFCITPFSLASAHSVLENSTPTDGEQLNDSINRIELSFNTKIENGSTLTLVNNKGEEVKPTSHEINDSVLVALFEDSLEPGTYQVNWKVIGADGHLIENQYSFTITEPEIMQEDNQTKSEEEHINNNSEKETSSTDEGKEDEVINSEEENQNQPTNNENEQTSLVMIIIIFLIIAGVGIVAWLLFSNRKKGRL
ncbi:copper resistance CopC family protein [Ureibacillus thermosphaericus]|uniref:copper resistance CopC family protein n=1 Tax=Ureibacillus thermosphaericus TaxID=51173 RepID=UPI0030C9F7F7